MKLSHKLPALVRYVAAIGLALIAERLLFIIAGDLGLLRALSDDLALLPVSYTVTFTMQRIALCTFLTFPALYVIEWLVESRGKSIAIGLIAAMVVGWFWAH